MLEKLNDNQLLFLNKHTRNIETVPLDETPLELLFFNTNEEIWVYLNPNSSFVLEFKDPTPTRNAEERRRIVVSDENGIVTRFSIQHGNSKRFPVRGENLQKFSVKSDGKGPLAVSIRYRAPKTTNPLAGALEKRDYPSNR